jgi:hypothetical protein
MVYNKYVIEKGNHRSNFSLGNRNLFRRSENFSVMVDKSFAQKNSQKSISKVFGYSDGLHHHKNSIRLGIIHNPATNKCVFHAYYYINGQRGFHKICEGDYGVWHDCEISFKKDKYFISVGDSFTFVERKGSFKSYPLYPYYGGNETPERRVTIKINYLD